MTENANIEAGNEKAKASKNSSDALLSHPHPHPHPHPPQVNENVNVKEEANHSDSPLHPPSPLNGLVRGAIEITRGCKTGAMITNLKKARKAPIT